MSAALDDDAFDHIAAALPGAARGKSGPERTNYLEADMRAALGKMLDQLEAYGVCDKAYTVARDAKKESMRGAVRTTTRAERRTMTTVRRRGSGRAAEAAARSPTATPGSAMCRCCRAARAYAGAGRGEP